MTEKFARWENQDACILEQKQIGHTEQSAKTICEEIRERAEKGLLYKAMPSLEILKSEGNDLIVGGPATWEIVDPENDYVTTEAMTNFLSKFFSLPEEYRNISIDHQSIIIGKALLQYPEQNPRYFSHVHEKGMYLIAKIRNDNMTYTQEYRKQIKDGTYKMYSIRGKALRHELAQIEGKTARKLYDIDPIEVAIVKEGMCPRAGPIQILKQDVTKRVEQRGNKWCVVHCSGPNEGEPIKCFDTKEEAEAMHAAIEANKNKTVTKEMSENEIREKLLQLYEKRDKHQKMLNAIFEENSSEQDELRRTLDVIYSEIHAFEEALGHTIALKMLKDERPPEDWWNTCISRAQSFADDPEAFCGDLWHNGPPDKRESFGKSMKADNDFLVKAEMIFRKHFPNYKSDKK